MSLRRPAAVAAAVALMGVAAPPAALAHECYNASRSEQGDTSADRARVWEKVQLAWVFADLHEWVGGPALTPAQVEQAVALAADAGLPTSPTIFVGKKTIAEQSAAMAGDEATDGDGIDYFFARYGEDILSIFFTVRGS